VSEIEASDETPAAKAPKAKPPKDKKAKDKAKKDKGKKAAAGGVSIAAHPQASHGVRTLKAWGGLIGFGLGAYMSERAGVPIGLLGLRALTAGVAGYMVAWFCGVVAWRAIVSAEVRAHMELRARTEQAKAAKH
jgi:hypothetical protein